MPDTDKLTTYVVHHGYGYSDEGQPPDSLVQAAGYEFFGEYERGGPTIVFKDAEGSTIAGFKNWTSFEREGGIVRREVDVPKKLKAPEHR
jgi:hypothetical protein